LRHVHGGIENFNTTVLTHASHSMSFILQNLIIDSNQDA